MSEHSLALNPRTVVTCASALGLRTARQAGAEFTLPLITCCQQQPSAMQHQACRGFSYIGTLYALQSFEYAEAMRVLGKQCILFQRETLTLCASAYRLSRS